MESRPSEIWLSHGTKHQSDEKHGLRTSQRALQTARLGLIPDYTNGCASLAMKAVVRH